MQPVWCFVLITVMCFALVDQYSNIARFNNSVSK